MLSLSIQGTMSIHDLYWLPSAGIVTYSGYGCVGRRKH
jgi:hypothetical protein